MKGGKNMERMEGLYLYKLEYKFENNKIMCVPIQYHGGNAFVLSSDKNGCWAPNSININDFDTIDDDTLYDRLCETGPLPPYDKTLFHCDLIPMKLDCGQLYNSIYRPLYTDNLRDNIFIPFDGSVPSLKFYRDLPITNYQEYSNQLRQLEIVLDDLDSVFKVISPQKKQGDVYGHAIRNIIILACTEIDSMMHTILERNEVKPSGKYYQMNDYYQLKVPLRLDEYQLSFYRFPELGSYTPFAEWQGDKISWYDGYNKIKHNREKEFPKACLNYAIDSIMAFAITMIAQFGYRNNLWNEKIGKIIRVNREPNWDLQDFYLQSSEGNNQVSFPFPKKERQISPQKQLAKEIMDLLNNIDKNKEVLLQKIGELQELLKDGQDG